LNCCHPVQMIYHVPYSYAFKNHFAIRVIEERDLTRAWAKGGGSF